MKVVVIGGTGLIGSKVVERLEVVGHEVIAASPRTGVDAITGDGLKEALAGASIVIDVSNSPANDGGAAMQFFTASGRNILAAEMTADVRHHVTLSIVGADRVPGQGYYEAKVAQERLVEDSGIAYTIIRATQFFEFLRVLADVMTQAGVVRVPRALLQPVAADDLADYLVEVALRDPRNGTVEMAGPDRIPFEDTLRRYLQAIGDGRTVVTDPDARYFGGYLAETSLVPLAAAHIGARSLDDWLRDLSTRPA